MNKINDVASKQIYTQIDNYAYENELNRQTYIKNMNNIVINMIYIMNLEKEEKNWLILKV